MVNEPFVNAGQFNINLSIMLLVAVVVGGAATIFGPALGAFFVVMIPMWLPDDVPAAVACVVRRLRSSC